MSDENVIMETLSNLRPASLTLSAPGRWMEAASSQTQVYIHTWHSSSWIANKHDVAVHEKRKVKTDKKNEILHLILFLNKTCARGSARITGP